MFSPNCFAGVSSPSAVLRAWVGPVFAIFVSEVTKSGSDWIVDSGGGWS
jgi:hypothetical protein